MKEDFDACSSLKDLRILIKSGSEKKKSIFELFIKPENFKRFVTNNFHIQYALDIFPEQREELYNAIIAPENFHNLIKKVDHVVDLVHEYFPEHNKEIFELLIRPENFNSLVIALIDLEIFVSVFPNDKDKIFSALFKGFEVQWYENVR